jgi:putrescine transport system substrate-binding protein
MAWSGDAVQAMRRVREVGVDVELAYSVPKEGTVVWFDGIFIPADAPHAENAHLFLNFLLRPEVIAPISDLTGYANGNIASIPFIDPKVSQDPASYPAQSELTNLNAGKIFGPKLERRRTRAWSRIKTGL